MTARRSQTHKSEEIQSESQPAAAVPEFEATAGEVQTKLDLARQFIDMGDPESARHMLDEALAEGDSVQKEEARRLVHSLP